MKHNATKHTEPNGSLVLVPQSLLEDLTLKQDKILYLLEKYDASKSQLGDYLPEEEAKELFGRKTTWFWQMRTSGKLAYSRIGNRIFYAKADIQNLLNQHRKEAIRK